MEKPPSFRFYPKDFLLSRKVRAMTPAQRGMYISLLANAWDSESPGTLPDDDNQLWWLAGCRSLEEWLKGGSTTVRNCFEIGSGLLINRRMVDERKKQIEWTENSRLGGIASGKARRNLLKYKHIQDMKGGSHSVEPNTNRTLEPNANRPEKEKEKKKEENAGAENSKYTEAFESFWCLYPRTNGSKAEAFKSWLKLNLSPPDFEFVISRLKMYVDCPQWKSGYVPHAATWLNQKRWETEPNMQGHLQEVKHGKTIKERLREFREAEGSD